MRRADLCVCVRVSAPLGHPIKGARIQMSPLLLEAPHAAYARRLRQARRKKKRLTPTRPKWSALDEPLATAHPNQVLTFREWCRINHISERTGRRLLASGTGPIVTQLSPHRIGITVGNNAAWQQSRARG